jgi:hypothetical protein
MREIEDHEFTGRSSVHKGKHLRCLVRWLGKRGYNHYDLANRIGVSPTVAHAICRRYLNIEDPCKIGSQLKEEFPKLASLKGIAPELTEGLSPEEFVRKQRDW